MIIERRQDEERLRYWRQELARHVYISAGEVAFEGFFTRERLTPEQAEKRVMQPCPPGTAWGNCWEYGWFRGDFVCPAQAAGQRLMLATGLGGEQLVYVNGRAAGSEDSRHSHVLLTREASAGESFHLLAESYAGHGLRLESL